ncbi:MAG: hypothetical protein JXL97_07600 [Bacteroidales bacterium]|nr:hypothetical protein [Bacteroidales bacterium]
MKVKILILFLLIFGIKTFAQERILLADRDISPKKDAPVHLTYGVHQGDKIVLTLVTNKDKPIDKIQIEENGKVLFSQNDVSPTQTVELTAPETNFLHLYFYDRQDVSVKIERVPANDEAKFFNPTIYQYKHYDTSYLNYEIDSVVGYDEIRTPKTFKVITSADYESVEMKTQKINLKGGKKKGILLTKPKELIQTDYKEMKLMGYQIIITSEAGADKMWGYIGVGVDIGAMCLSLAVSAVASPVGGAAAELAVQTAFEMIGPQEGGEPIYYMIANNDKDLAKFTDDNPDTRPSAYEFGLATGYNNTWFVMDTLAIGLQNLNIAVEVDVSVAVYAIYQSTIWEDIVEDIVTIKPKTVKVQRTRQVIQNNKRWNFEE